jgi:hypothetical protein
MSPASRARRAPRRQGRAPVARIERRAMMGAGGPAAGCSGNGDGDALTARGTHPGMTRSPPVVEGHALELGTGTARGVEGARPDD